MAGRSPGLDFFPLLLLEGLSLHTDGLKRVLSRDKVEHRWVEIAFLTIRLGGLAALVLAVLPPGKRWPSWPYSWPCSASTWGPPSPPTTSACHWYPRNSNWTSCAGGCDEPQHHRRTAHLDLHGRAQLPGRTPPVPLHGAASSAQDPIVGGDLLRRRRGALHPNQPVRSYRTVIGYLHGRTERLGPVPLPPRRPTPRPLTPNTTRTSDRFDQRPTSHSQARLATRCVPLGPHGGGPEVRLQSGPSTGWSPAVPTSSPRRARGGQYQRQRPHRGRAAARQICRK